MWFLYTTEFFTVYLPTGLLFLNVLINFINLNIKESIKMWSFETQVYKHVFLNKTNTLGFRIFWVNIVIFYIYIYVLTLHNIQFLHFYINNLIITQITIFTYLFILVYIILFLSSASIKFKFLTDVGFLFINFYLLVILILISSNLLVIFITLELLNIIIIYSYYSITMFYQTMYKKLNFTKIWLINTITYQFILNYISSLILYLVFNIILSQISTINLIDLTLWSNESTLLSSSYVFLFFGFLIKLGLGPWIFLKIEIYKGLNLNLIVFYNLLYFSGLLIFYFNLFLIYRLFLQNIVLIFGLIFIIISVSIIIWYIFNIYNFFIFCSISSLINLFYFINQIIFILVN